VRNVKHDGWKASSTSLLDTHFLSHELLASNVVFSAICSLRRSPHQYFRRWPFFRETKVLVRSAKFSAVAEHSWFYPSVPSTGKIEVLERGSAWQTRGAQCHVRQFMRHGLHRSERLRCGEEVDCPG
jgi:hypothetical protein